MMAERDNNLLVKSLENDRHRVAIQYAHLPTPFPQDLFQSGLPDFSSQLFCTTSWWKGYSEHETVLDISSKAKTNELVYSLHLKPFRKIAEKICQSKSKICLSSNRVSLFAFPLKRAWFSPCLRTDNCIIYKQTKRSLKVTWSTCNRRFWMKKKQTNKPTKIRSKTGHVFENTET